MKIAVDAWKARLDSLRKSIEAPLSEWVPTYRVERKPPTWEVSLSTVGLDVDLDQLLVDDDGLYTFEGRRVLIYIRVTRQPADLLLHDKHAARRFHFRDCRTIRKMRDHNRFQRYVAIARDDGLFPVISEELDGSSRELDAALGPCKDCLTEIDYDGYTRADKPRKQEIWDTFDIKRFLERFSTSVSPPPRHYSQVTRADGYVADWQVISLAYRDSVGWRCEQCDVRLPGDPDLLHVHHRNGVRSDNQWGNLQALCVECHKKQLGHGRMYISEDQQRRLHALRAAKGDTR